MFVADLTRKLDFPFSVDFLRASSYGDSVVTSGEVRMELDLQHSISNRHVLIVEDIVDTGLTVKYLKANLETRNPASVRVCTLLHKPANNVKLAPLDFCGFEIPNHFVVGYGLDWQGYYPKSSLHCAGPRDRQLSTRSRPPSGPCAGTGWSSGFPESAQHEPCCPRSRSGPRGRCPPGPPLPVS